MTSANGTPNRRSFRGILYFAMLLATLLAFLAIRQLGESGPRGDARSPDSTPAKDNELFHVLLALACVVALGRLLAACFRFIGQPAVIGEVVAGIVLGPSLLGRIAPEVQQFILPQSVGPALEIIAQVAVIVYMFLVGLELDASLLQKRGHMAVAISHAGIVVPFLLGSSLALLLYPELSPEGVGFTAFALFLGAAMSVTAFPVLARILTDRRVHNTALGVMALTCAAVQDVTAWCLLAIVVGVAGAAIGKAIQVVGFTLAFLAVTFIVVRPVFGRLAKASFADKLTPGLIAIVMVAMLTSAFVTEAIGIHAIFGAFLLGAMIPHDSVIAREMPGRLSDLVAVVLLPAFFALTGMRTEIGLVSGAENWLICGLIILVATAGKFGGTLAAARVTGLTWRESSILGTLMNTRGLMELIVLNIGLDLGVISPTLFAMMVIMAVVTTMATAPILHVLWPESRCAYSV
jgi:Kef-type K+ transport system membrane component KefB